MHHENDVRRKRQFRLRTLFVVVFVVAVVLGGWFSWVRPRLAFEARRRESMARLDWTGKDAAAEYRTKQITRASEQFSYGRRSTPSLAYAGINDGSGILNVDWIGVDQGMQVRGIEITGDETVRMSIESDYVEHEAGLLIFTTTIRKGDHPEKWPQLTSSVKLQARLIIGEEEKSNPIDLSIIE